MKHRMQVHGTKIEARRPQDLERAWSQYYSRLAAHFVARINRKSLRVVLEAGCGKGQLTLPLIEMLPKGAQMIAIDSSRGPYAGWLTELKTRLMNKGLEERVRVI